jgi:histidyl-tRNA synthetase
MELKIPVTVKFNNRKILTALAEVLGEREKIVDITVAIDKLDKIGKEGVNSELAGKGISLKAIEQLQPLLIFKGSNADKLKVLEDMVGETAAGKQGIEEIKFILEQAAHLNHEHISLELDITLARGLNYYTGTIFEVKTHAGTLSSSILGGGRYDDLTGIFGLPGMSGVGISFGIDRIYDVMEELDLFPLKISSTSSTTVLFTHFDEPTQLHCLKLAEELRKNEISCEIYPDLTKKLGKQVEYANKKNIPIVCTVGSNEMQSGNYSLKHMETGVKQQLNIADMIHYIKSLQ